MSECSPSLHLRVGRLDAGPFFGRQKEPGVLVGGGAQRVRDADGDAAPGEPGEDPFNREYAKKQTVMALEYLKDQLAKEKPDLVLTMGTPATKYAKDTKESKLLKG